VLPSFFVVEFKVDSESAFYSCPLCVTFRSFGLPCCFRYPWRGWAENDFFRDD
jgi:hypothetical protein